MTNNPVGWFEIYVENMGRAKAFYEAVFDVKLEELKSPEPSMAEMWSFPMHQNATGAAGALARMPGGPSGGGSSTIVYFTSKDCAVESQRVTAAGGRVMKDKLSIEPYGFIALIIDTEGNTIGVHSMQ